jgi:hypothetical protein
MPGARATASVILHLMTLIDFITLTEEVARSTSRVKDGMSSSESPEELELLVCRLANACNSLAGAKCGNATSSNLREAARLIEKGRRLVFALKMTGSRDEFPKLCVEK